MATATAMQPAAYGSRGKSEPIGYHIGPAPHAELGLALIAATPRGLCAILLGDSSEQLIAELGRRFPAAVRQPDPGLQSELQAVFSDRPNAHPLPLDLQGTVFQTRVWAALGTIPRGETRTYAHMAQSIGQPKAVRAVAAACGANPAAVLVPCHRVVGSNGKLTGYRWGLARKQALLAREGK